jgi:acyl-CoA thioesterase FadM
LSGDLASFSAAAAIDRYGIQVVSATELLLPEARDVVDVGDGHLGYTQLLRLFECARFTFWSLSLVPWIDRWRLPIHDCTAVRVHATFQHPIDGVSPLSIRTRLTSVGTSSWTMQTRFSEPNGLWGASIDGTFVFVGVQLSPQPVPTAAASELVNAD